MNQPKGFCDDINSHMVYKIKKIYIRTKTGLPIKVY